MLTHLHIANYALIDRLDIDFEAGFSVITGETGAGKSIILGALGLLLGNRADAKTIKAGAAKCVVEGTFDISKLGLGRFFSENDIENDSLECIVRREVATNGKSRAFVNDTPVTVAKFKELTTSLIDIHSQHQNLLLGHEGFLLETLDTMAHNQALRDNYTEAYHTWRTAARRLDTVREQAKKDKDDTDYLRFQLTALDEAGLVSGEQEELEHESAELSHAEEIKSGLLQAEAPMTADEANLLSALKLSASSLQGIADYFPAAGELAERIESARIELEDIAEELDRSAERIEFSPERQAYVDDRLDIIYGLQKKHHVDTVEELLALRDELQRRIDDIENLDDRLKELEAETARTHDTLIKVGKALRISRETAGRDIAARLLETLQSLGMPSAKLHFVLTPRPMPDASGLDTAALLFSANKNVPEQDVTLIASGGEIARLMLALKALLSSARALPTIIFDEIDTGVSGTMAEKMAQVMLRMADSCQVLCITHLPQIAACGHQHYRVYKAEDQNGTTSHIDHLTSEARIHEIANMLSGEQITEAAINNAKSLLHL